MSSSYVNPGRFNETAKQGCAGNWRLPGYRDWYPTRTGALVILAARTVNVDDGITWGMGGPTIPGSLSETVAQIIAAGGRAIPYQIDLSSTAEIENMISYIEMEHGRIDILVNCAMGFPDSYKGEVWNASGQDWHAFMDIGVRAKYITSHFVSKIMMRQESGLIANISAGPSKIEYYNPVFRMVAGLPTRIVSG